MIRGLPSLAWLALGTAAFRRHLRSVLPARTSVYRRKDLHEDANARFIRRFFNPINYNQYMTSMGCISWAHSPR
jgi:hypothetical protein